MIARRLISAVILVTGLSAFERARTVSAGVSPPSCEIAASDHHWLDQALAAVAEVADDTGGRVGLGRTLIFVFDAHCLVRIAPDGDRHVTPHGGMVPLPGGARPATIMSYAAPGAGPDSAYFVMALPSVWETAGFSSEIPLHAFTLGVFAHEISHVWQLPTYFESMKRIPDIERLPSPVDDDLVQRLFAGDAAFRTGVETDIDALRKALEDDDIRSMRVRVQQVRDRIKARWAGAFVGDLSALHRLAPIFLTLEGSGQWFAMRALSAAPSGPRLEANLALRAFGGRGGKWSQDLGLALATVLDRLDPGWAADVYGSGSRSLIDLLDAALERPL